MQNLRTLAEHFRSDVSAFHSNEWGLEPVSIMNSWVEQESSWDPYATREEPGFFEKYIRANLVGASPREKHEQWGLATSWGLLQVMGVVARERGYTGKYLAQLTDPSLGLYFGLEHLMHQKGRGDGSWSQALAAYNGGLGGNRHAGRLRNQSYVDEIVHRARHAG